MGGLTYGSGALIEEIRYNWFLYFGRVPCTENTFTRRTSKKLGWWPKTRNSNHFSAPFNPELAVSVNAYTIIDRCCSKTDSNFSCSSMFRFARGQETISAQNQRTKHGHRWIRLHFPPSDPWNRSVQCHHLTKYTVKNMNEKWLGFFRKGEVLAERSK